MKYKMTVGGFLFMLLTTSAMGFEGHPFGDTKEKHCYALGMIGLDSVINARLGVYPEHVLNLSVQPPPPGIPGDAYANDILNTVLSAYLWKDTPHAYALKVFYACAVKNGATH